MSYSWNGKKVGMDGKKLNEKPGVNEEQLETWATEYETDTWDSSRLGKVVMDRPSLADEEVNP